MSEDMAYRAACERARARRAALTDSAHAAAARIAPARLREDLREKVVQGAHNTVHKLQAGARKRPVAAGAAGIALIAWFARRPLWTLLRRLFVDESDEELRDDRPSSETDNG
ncbi:MAG: hypothetical protein QHC40_02840 [Sphingobium sp.]|nr:hypothetical protein [Sphingobium sp.]